LSYSFIKSTLLAQNINVNRRWALLDTGNWVMKPAGGLPSRYRGRNEFEVCCSPDYIIFPASIWVWTKIPI
jgi:hypothetical protein